MLNIVIQSDATQAPEAKKLRKYMMDNAEYFLDLDRDGNYAVAALLGEGERYLNIIAKEMAKSWALRLARSKVARKVVWKNAYR